jgi:ABC-type nickel/cobalt efflux system permease component RcnA
MVSSIGRVVLIASAEVFGLGFLVTAFLFGFRHGIDWDHIAAITDITGSQDDRSQAFAFGTLYALGHALVVFVIGVAAIVLGERLPPGIDDVMQRIVGATLVVLGLFVFTSLIRHGREFRMRSRWMLIFSGARSAYRKIRPERGEAEDPDHAHRGEPVHMHAAEDEGVALAVAEDLPVSEWHHGHHGRPGHHHHKHPEPDAFMNYGRRTAFGVGMIHGVGAETPTQVLIFLAAAGASGKGAGVVVLLAFLVGLLASNSLITLGSSFGFLRASQNWKIYVTVAVLTGIFSLVIGTLFLFGKSSLLPGLFGG